MAYETLLQISIITFTRTIIISCVPSPPNQEGSIKSIADKILPTWYAHKSLGYWMRGTIICCTRENGAPMIVAFLVPARAAGKKMDVRQLHISMLPASVSPCTVVSCEAYSSSFSLSLFLFGSTARSLSFVPALAKSFTHFYFFLSTSGRRNWTEPTALYIQTADVHP